MEEIKEMEAKAETEMDTQIGSTFACYLLVTDDGRHTYVGATVDVDRRLRQHNHEIVGGARATGIQVAKGQNWKRVCYVTGMPDWRSALQLEWRWKQLGRTRCKTIRHPVERRLHALHELLRMDRPTSAAMPYFMYPLGSPVIHWDMTEWNEWYATRSFFGSSTRHE